MSLDYKDYYKILGIERNASADDIQKAYKKLARKYHPDLNPGDTSAEDKFKDIGEAYEVLKDPQKRMQYDSLGSAWKDGQSFTPPPGWGNFGFGGGGGQNIHFNVGGMGGMSDFFQTLFGGGMGGMGGGFSAQDLGGFGCNMGGGRRRSAQSAQAQEESAVDLNLTVSDLLDLQPKPISLVQNLQTRSIKVNIPKGAKDKTVFKLKGQAADGGDLRIRINIKDSSLTTDDFDIIQKLKVTPWEAALGAHLAVHTVEGDVKLTLPAGVQSGQKLRLSGKGLYKKSGRGDLLMEVLICTPKKLTPKEKELFEELASVSSFAPRD